MAEFFSVALVVVCAIACYKMAEDQGRNKWLALVLGTLFTWIPVIVYVLLGKKKEKISEETNQTE